MPEPFDFAASTLRIGDGPEMPVLNCEITWQHEGDMRTTYTLGEGGIACAGTIHSARPATRPRPRRRDPADA